MTDKEATNGEEGAEPQQRKTVLIAAAVIVVLLLCCCLLVGLAWFYGDTLVGQFSLLASGSPVGL